MRTSCSCKMSDVKRFAERLTVTKDRILPGTSFVQCSKGGGLGRNERRDCNIPVGWVPCAQRTHCNPVVNAFNIPVSWQAVEPDETEGGVL